MFKAMSKPTFKPLGCTYWQVRIPRVIQPPFTVQLLFKRAPQSAKLMPLAVCHDEVAKRMAISLHRHGLANLEYQLPEYHTRWDSLLKMLHVLDSKLPLSTTHFYALMEDAVSCLLQS